MSQKIDGMNILGIDIETSPNSVHVWGLWNQNIGINQIQQTGRVMCYAAKWYGRRPIEFVSEYHNSHEEVIKGAHLLLDTADAVLTYNGKSFDVPTLNREFLKYGMKPPSPYHHIDLYQVAKRQFRFASNKMDHLCQELGLRTKVRHEGHELWTKCMAGDDKAWQRMRKYNTGDILMLEELYDELKPWISTHPNHAMYSDDSRPACTNCGSHKLQSRGVQVTRTQKYTRYQCQDCGTWQRSRFTEASASKRKSTLIQC